MEPVRPKDDSADSQTPASPLSDATTYEKPALTHYGSVTRLTRNTAGSSVDAMGARRMTCL